LRCTSDDRYYYELMMPGTHESGYRSEQGIDLVGGFPC
jgi:hypothetical protein